MAWDDWAALANQKLPPQQEVAFQRDMQMTRPYSDWRNQFAAKFGEQPNLAPGGDYNYRAAYVLGAKPELDPGSGETHWPSNIPVAPYAQPFPLKAPDHPTEWMQEFMDKFGVNPQVQANGAGLTPEMGKFIGNEMSKMRTMALAKSLRSK